MCGEAQYKTSDTIRYLALRTTLNKDLVVQVVVVRVGEDVDVPHDLEHIDTLLERLARQMHLHELQAILLLGEVAHLGVGLPVVQGHGREVVEGLVEVVLNVRLEVDAAIKEAQRLDVDQRRKVLDSVLERVTHAHLQVAVNVVSEINLEQASERAREKMH